MSETPEVKKGFLSNARENPWMVSTLVLGVLFLATLILYTSVGPSVTGNVISEKAVSDKVLAYAQAQGVDGASIDSVSKTGDAYTVTVNVNGQKVPLLLSADGKYLLQPFDTTTTAGTPTTGVKADVTVGDAPVIGDANAPVTIVEFSDFSCPFCAAASGDNADMVAYMKKNNPSWESPVQGFMRDYVQTGKVRFAVKYSMGHSGGHPAQLVAWCLNDQSSDLHWKFYAEAFAHQADVEDAAKMRALAQTLGADMTKLDACLSSKKYDDRFDREQAEGQAAGAQGTPAFFVNGRLVSGAVPYSQMKTVIDAELAAVGQA